MLNDSEKLDLYLNHIYIYRDDVYRIIKTVFNDKYVADELTQIVMANAWKGLHRLKSVSKSKAWVKAITRNVIRAHMKEKQIYISLEGVDMINDIKYSEDLHQMEEDVLDFITRQEDMRMICKALESLEPVYQMIVRKHVVGEISLKEIAESSGMKYGTVRVMYARGIRMLKIAFMKQERGVVLNG